MTQQFARIPPPKIQTVAQKMPAKLSVGTVLYKAYAFFDDATGRASTEIREWHVRTIKKNRSDDAAPMIHLVVKVDGGTWGKLSKTSGDYGWLPAISADFRDSFVQGEYMGWGFATTPDKALALEIGHTKHRINRYKAWDSEPGSIGFSDNINGCLVEIEALERRKKTLATKRKTAKAEKGQALLNEGPNH
jgi:hypothetical protein